MVNIGDLVTPTGRLVIGPGGLGSEQWLLKRGWRNHTIGPYSLGYCIGSSDVPSILDLDGVDTPAHVYRKKVYRIDTPVNSAMRFGSLFEDAIAMDWCRRNRAVIDEIGLVARDGMPWRQSTIDRRVRECPVWPEKERECGLEIKHVEHVHKPRWNTANGIPDRVTAQIIDQLLNTGYDHIHYAIKVPGDFKQGVIHRADSERLMRYVDFAVERFRNDHLVRGIEPDWNMSKADKMIELDNLTYPERDHEHNTELDIDGIGDVMEYARTSAAAGAAKRAHDKSAARLRQLAAGAEHVTFANELAYRVGTSPRKKVDVERLAERWPEAYADVVSEKGVHTIYLDKAYKVKREES